MALSWTLATVAMLTVLVVLMYVAAVRRDHALPAWHIAFQSESAPDGPCVALEKVLNDELESLLDTLEHARTKREMGNVDDARRALSAAAEHAACYAPSLPRRLRLWWATARAVAALYPLPRLRVMRFKGWRLRSVATGELALRPWLTRLWRFGLRVRVLVYGIDLVVAAFQGERRALHTGTPDLDQALRHMASLGADLETLQVATLDVYKALLISMHRQATTRQ